MKKRILILLAALILLVGAYLVTPGFIKNGSAFIHDYSVSADGSAITLTVGVADSVGYIRKVAVNQQQGGTLYLDCYNSFGGFNGTIGAKNTYTIPLVEDTTRIALNRSHQDYQDILEKNAEGEWQRVNSIDLSQ